MFSFHKMGRGRGNNLHMDKQLELSVLEQETHSQTQPELIQSLSLHIFSMRI